VTITFQRLLGGAWIKPDTSCDIRGLFIAGESAGGVHGADRLQGGAFLETQVFGRLAGVGATNFVSRRKCKEFPESLVKKYRDKLLNITMRQEGPEANDILQKLHQLTWDHAGIVRNADGLKKGITAIEDLREDLNKAVGRHTFEVLEVQNLALTAEVVMRSASAREETRGTHIRNDFPQTREELARKHISIRYKKKSQMEVTTVPSRE
jgi:succinate dehydrogenase/fumarate reductase flavoprotein subunit